MRRRVHLLVPGVVALMLAACAITTGVRPNPFNPVHTVAVLPVYNATNDVEAPQRVREEFSKRLARWHYAVKPLDEVDRILRDRMGITLGSQLEMTTAKELGEVLGVDGVVYGYLLNFDDVTTGVYNVKKVRAGFKLVEAGSGRIMWARGQGVKSELISGGMVGKGLATAKGVKDKREGIEPFKSIKGIEGIAGLEEWHVLERREEKSVGDAALFSLGEKLVSKAIGMHLKVESDKMLKMIMGSMPPGPGGAR
ncbi:MAG: GNA1162 family protein [Thermodesulfobacteriota bacterium]